MMKKIKKQPLLVLNTCFKQFHMLSFAYLTARQHNLLTICSFKEYLYDNDK